MNEVIEHVRSRVESMSGLERLSRDNRCTARLAQQISDEFGIRLVGWELDGTWGDVERVVPVVVGKLSDEKKSQILGQPKVSRKVTIHDEITYEVVVNFHDPNHCTTHTMEDLRKLVRAFDGVPGDTKVVQHRTLWRAVVSSTHEQNI